MRGSLVYKVSWHTFIIIIIITEYVQSEIDYIIKYLFIG